MRGLWKRGVTAAALGLAVAFGFAPTGASAHGGVKLEQDECVLHIGQSAMHFIGYQRTGEEQEFCEDIAQTGPTVIALQAVSDELRDMAIGIRIIKDVGGEANEKGDLTAATIVKLDPKVYRNGIMTFEHDFKDAGHYVGIVTVRDDLGNEWVSRFPFSVGLYTFWGMIEYILYAVGFVSLTVVMWLALRAKSNRQKAEHAARAAA
ncbi:hypothetical protein [Methylocystis parvus]|uniref:Uncharacterized protein n=1 Tax=Methylocystis parvus TaxID=134 RepID=A0A6B8M866_9HYPH|nr:hypothetical protein [Methylocystis parvus]QGM98951.1 hypothetical protein F7D14_16635 [Methylocystis parvus]WBK00692.1 hypothetical protein MMG94_02900 [Methylocystis parvus OBBP]